MPTSRGGFEGREKTNLLILSGRPSVVDAPFKGNQANYRRVEKSCIIGPGALMKTDLLVIVGTLGTLGLVIGHLASKLKELKPIPVKAENREKRKARK
jgi:hypothetical protein